MSASSLSCLALSGGVGGAKLALGLARLLPAERLTVVANTGDDFEHLGLHVSPDLDTLLYTLADLANPETGWGRRDESFHFLDALGELGGETWFRLGDRDLATHVERTRLLRAGESLSQVIDGLATALGIAPRILPMSDDPVRTVVHTRTGDLAFQHYFVRERCEPAVTGFSFRGIEQARPHPDFLARLADPELGAIVVCPSNPFVSVDPILLLPGVEERIRRSAAPLVAVSPIVGGLALKGPAAKMMQELGLPQSAVEVARHYGSRKLLQGFVIDETDTELKSQVEELDVPVLVAQTVMRTLEDRIELARQVLDFAAGLRRHPPV